MKNLKPCPKCNSNEIQVLDDIEFSVGVIIANAKNVGIVKLKVMVQQTVQK